MSEDEWNMMTWLGERIGSIARSNLYATKVHALALLPEDIRRPKVFEVLEQIDGELADEDDEGEEETAICDSAALRSAMGLLATAKCEAPATHEINGFPVCAACYGEILPPLTGG